MIPCNRVPSRGKPRDRHFPPQPRVLRQPKTVEVGIGDTSERRGLSHLQSDWLKALPVLMHLARSLVSPHQSAVVMVNTASTTREGFGFLT